MADVLKLRVETENDSNKVVLRDKIQEWKDVTQDRFLKSIESIAQRCIAGIVLKDTASN